MALKHSLPGLLLALSISVSANASGTDMKLFRQASRLYELGMYDRARVLFEKCGDSYADSWAVLCAVKSRAAGCGEKLAAFEKNNPVPANRKALDYALALKYFDEGRYDLALPCFEASFSLPSGDAETAECSFKRGYCQYAVGDKSVAKVRFREVLSLPKSTWTAPAAYTLAYILYIEKDFKSALPLFEQASSDKRFGDISSFFLLECRFMQKDYGYVAESGVRVYGSAPSERKPRIARMLSESFLVKGDKAQAKKYFELERTVGSGTGRSDRFHAGSVLYSVSDFKGAIENYSRMPDRTDSLGQIANYQLGYSYVRTGNKVAALNAFKAASELSFDEAIKEDALFNSAKLSFDLNSDTSLFGDYIKRYGSSRKGSVIYDYMALTCLYNHDYTGAVNAYSNIDELNREQKSNFMKANYLRARQLLQSGSNSDAVPYLKAAAFYLPRNDRFNQLSRYWLGEALYRSGDYGRAESVFSDLYNNSSLRGMKEAETLPYNLGYCCLKLGKYADAARWFDKYCGKDFREDAMTRRADCDFARRDFASAIDTYGKVVSSGSSAVYPAYQQALAYGLSGDRNKKIEVLQKAIRVPLGTPMYSDAMYELGRAYVDDGKNREAYQTFSALRATTADSTFAARALIGMGMSCRNMKEYNKALSCYERVVEMMPGSEYAEDAAAAVASICQKTGRPDDYLDFMEKHKLDSGKTMEEKENVYFNTAEQVFLAGRHSEAEDSFEKYLGKYPEGSHKGDAWFYIAESRKALGENEKACEAYSKAASLLKSGSFAESSLLNLANLSYGLERYQDSYKAWSELRETAVMEENRKLSVTGMMRSAWKAGDYENAIAAASSVGTSEADYIMAKSYLATSRRDKAIGIFTRLSAHPSTPEGAEASFILIKDLLDKGEFDKVESKVYDFAAKCGEQRYWLAKAYLALGDAFLAEGNAVQARATYESIRDGYVPAGPDDDIRDNVKLRLEKLK